MEHDWSLLFWVFVSIFGVSMTVWGLFLKFLDCNKHD